MCLYFLLQLGSGHSRSTGLAGGEPLGGIGGGARLLFLSSSSGPRDFRFAAGSGRGGTNAAGLGLAAGEPCAPRRPFAPPFLSLLCTELLVSVKLLRSLPGVAFAAALPRLPRPFGVRASRSLVGESQNLGGAQSCRVQSSSVPTYVFPRHVTFTTSTPAIGNAVSHSVDYRIDAVENQKPLQVLRKPGERDRLLLLLLTTYLLRFRAKLCPRESPTSQVRRAPNIPAR